MKDLTGAREVVDKLAIPPRMKRMTTRFAVLLLCASLLPAVQSLAKSKTILPDACGDDSIQFDAKEEKDNPALTVPDDSKALIVFIETMPGERMMQSTTRFGIDGAWVGATKNTSYFTRSVSPGEHNLCASMQSAPSREKKAFTHVASLTAEPGKVYYFEAQIATANILSLDFAQLSEAEGKYRVKAWKFATSKPKK
jgi:hypothetical protein